VFIAIMPAVLSPVPAELAGIVFELGVPESLHAPHSTNIEQLTIHRLVM
jgi:hypothetical protein